MCETIGKEPLNGQAPKQMLFYSNKGSQFSKKHAKLLSDEQKQQVESWLMDSNALFTGNTLILIQLMAEREEPGGRSLSH